MRENRHAIYEQDVAGLILDRLFDFLVICDTFVQTVGSRLFLNTMTFVYDQTPVVYRVMIDSQ